MLEERMKRVFLFHAIWIYLIKSHNPNYNLNINCYSATYSNNLKSFDKVVRYQTWQATSNEECNYFRNEIYKKERKKYFLK